MKYQEALMGITTGYSSVGRASGCRRLQQSDAPWFDSGGRIFETQDHIAKTNLLKYRAHPDLNQGPADLQSAALTTKLCAQMLS